MHDQCCMTELRVELHTFSSPVDNNLVEVHLLCVRAQRNFRITKEIFSDLRLPELLEIGLIPVDTAARLVKFDDSYNIVHACFLAIEASHHVARESFRTKYNYDIDCDKVWSGTYHRRRVEFEAYLKILTQCAV